MDLTRYLWAEFTWRQMGRHSGLSPLPRYINQKRPGAITMLPVAPVLTRWISASSNRLLRAIGLIRQLPAWVGIQQNGVPFYGQEAWFAERKIIDLVRYTAPDWVVMTSIEDQLFLLAKDRPYWPKTRLAGFSHQPQSWWQANHFHPDVAQSLDLLIVLSSQAEQYWRARVPPERIVYLPHGVDTDFFRPSGIGATPESLGRPMRVVCSGQWLRDFGTLGAVVAAASELNMPIEFDLIASRQLRKSGSLGRLNNVKNVSWHHDLSDEQLRNVYQQADLLLLPLIDGSANNSLLEGMACGLPVAVTDVGGVRDYTHDGFADYLRPESTTDILDVLRKYQGKKHELETRGAIARTHAETRLSWNVIADRFLACLDRYQ